MADPRFFTTAGPFTLAQLAEVAKARLAPGADGGKQVVDVASLDAAGSEHVSFLDNRRYLEAFAKSGAGACLVYPDLADRAPHAMALLFTETPYLAFARVARAFHPPPPLEPGVAPTAVVDLTAKLGEGCRIEPGAVIRPRTEIGARCYIGPNAVIGTGVTLGDDCVIGACASLSYCLVGNRVVINPGARVGQEGFGFATGQEGHVKIPQVGRVILHDDVEVGANTTIDRGSGADTIIGQGCMIDNLVQIAHNVQLGRGCVLSGQVGISGSTKLGDFVVLGGQVGLAGHLTVGDRAMLAAKSGVHNNLDGGQAYGGSPAVAIKEWRRQAAWLALVGKRKVKR